MIYRPVPYQYTKSVPTESITEERVSDIFNKLADIQDDLVELGLYEAAFYLGIASSSISEDLKTLPHINLSEGVALVAE